ncbi:rod shape-determining protein MreD [Ramlibacter sp. H39-3-26]|uniref:rod shape-determining protein MreD n=1 Tax=Curvibacter soli TaxID=3031331 RepID=UPI0023DA82F4|nr:rod shape-determining protein MreD [Ramlibacter sp. H39-3-26]MDF1486100.1 rod shape-determining protein MreD [Ramlibacter sp. H39-3-26]
MSTPRRATQQLLLPVNPVFIWVSLVVALAVNMLPLGRAAWRPDLLMLLLLFWGVHQPLRVGMGAAFAFGLCMDVQQTALLGQHALAYVALVFLAITIERRLLWFSLVAQAVQVLPLFLAAHVVEVPIRMLAGGAFPGLDFLLAPLIEAALWPLASLILLAPQRRPPDRDENRPL